MLSIALEPLGNIQDLGSAICLDEKQFLFLTNFMYFCISNLWQIIAQRNYKDSYNCPCKLIIGFLDWDKFAAEPLEKLKSAMSFKIARTHRANYI